MIKDKDYIFDLGAKIRELEKRLDEKDAQIANIQESYQHIVDRMVTVPFEGKIVGFEVKE